jgi:hypothetical protein
MAMQPATTPCQPTLQVDQTTTKPTTSHPRARGTPDPEGGKNQPGPSHQTRHQGPRRQSQRGKRTAKQPQNNKEQYIIEAGGLCLATPLVSAFVSFIVVGGGFGVVLVVCFGCVLGGFLFCFCFVFCFVLFFFCVGGGGIVRFIYWCLYSILWGRV